MPEKRANAINLLQHLVQQRKWYGANMERTAAGDIKRRVIAGQLSYEKACEILNLLGYEKIREEVWRSPEP